eukprot:89515_1
MMVHQTQQQEQVQFEPMGAGIHWKESEGIAVSMAERVTPSSCGLKGKRIDSIVAEIARKKQKPSDPNYDAEMNNNTRMLLSLYRNTKYEIIEMNGYSIGFVSIIGLPYCFIYFTYFFQRY